MRRHAGQQWQCAVCTLAAGAAAVAVQHNCPMRFLPAPAPAVSLYFPPRVDLSPPSRDALRNRRHDILAYAFPAFAAPRGRRALSSLSGLREQNRSTCLKLRVVGIDSAVVRRFVPIVWWLPQGRSSTTVCEVSIWWRYKHDAGVMIYVQSACPARPDSRFTSRAVWPSRVVFAHCALRACKGILAS